MFRPLQVRLNLPSTLLDDGCRHMQNVLCGSVMGRKIYTMPFHRDVQLTAKDARSMAKALARCQQVRGRTCANTAHASAAIVEVACRSVCTRARGGGVDGRWGRRSGHVPAT